MGEKPIDDGGPAFPIPETEWHYHNEGMSLCGTVEIGGVSMKVKDWAATAAPTGLLRADGSLCLDLLPMEYYGEAFRVVQGPLYNPESIDRDKVYATTSVAGIPPERLTD